MSRLVVLVMLVGAGAVRAEGQPWSSVGARTVPLQGNVLQVEAGWPGLSVGWLHGAAPALSLGARLGFIYGVQGLVREVVPGLQAQALLKLQLFDTGRVSMALTFEPGTFFVGPGGGVARFGLLLPVGLRLGIATSSAFTVALLVEAPFWLQFGVGFNVPLLSGVGVEYFVSSQLALFFRGTLGPTLRPGGASELTFTGSLGVAFEFPSTPAPTPPDPRS
jgi:hypothetical protein